MHKTSPYRRKRGTFLAARGRMMHRTARGSALTVFARPKNHDPLSEYTQLSSKISMAFLCIIVTDKDRFP
ncbi:hypothetical protein HMPREF3213_01130 [Heyndrickxia coagulans]|uniref:Uncharacterized protein n=1 Tax=Heyndrickxia coagulans TaxID=1398 RepID=A0A133KWX9_HEYCO|nr:hypothetical protein HMPREF3213_01130 [Heyndrickxia coagulans]